MRPTRMLLLLLRLLLLLLFVLNRDAGVIGRRRHHFPLRERIPVLGVGSQPQQSKY